MQVSRFRPKYSFNLTSQPNPRRTGDALVVRRMEIKMKLISLFCVFFGIFAATQVFAQNELAGRWMMDDVVVAKKHLPRVTWLIAVDEKTLTLTEFSDQGEMVRKLTYNLDGTQTREVSQSANKESTYKFKWNKSKHSVEIRETQVVSGIANIPPQRYEIKETWELANGGRTLKVVQKINSGNPELLGFELFDSRETFQKVQE
jgi:hypothetical protein